LSETEYVGISHDTLFYDTVYLITRSLSSASRSIITLAVTKICIKGKQNTLQQPVIDLK